MVAVPCLIIFLVLLYYIGMTWRRRSRVDAGGRQRVRLDKGWVTVRSAGKVFAVRKSPAKHIISIKSNTTSYCFNPPGMPGIVHAWCRVHSAAE